MSDLGVVLDEAVVEVAKAEKHLELFKFLGCGPFCNAGDFYRVHLDLTLGDDDTKILNGELVEGAFFEFEVEVVFGEAGKDVVGKFVKESEVVVEDENVVEVDNEVILVDEVRKNEVHKGLKGGGCHELLGFS